MMNGYLNIINDRQVEYFIPDSYGLPVEYPVRIYIQKNRINTGEIVIINDRKEEYELCEKYRKMLTCGT